MSIQVGGDDDELNGTINVVPLTDIMLVLLIIFLITIPVVTNTIPVKLPNERNQPAETKPKDIVIAVDKEGQMYWGTADRKSVVSGKRVSVREDLGGGRVIKK